MLEEILPTLAPQSTTRISGTRLLCCAKSCKRSHGPRTKSLRLTRYRNLRRPCTNGRRGDEDAIEAAEKCLEIAAVYELYEKAKTERQAVDFGDLIMLPQAHLEERAVRAAERLRHRHVLVDEYQDVNRASVRLVKALAGDGKNLWVVGDARQSIYRFRGASSANMAAFADDFPGATAEPARNQLSIHPEDHRHFQRVRAGMDLPAELRQADARSRPRRGQAGSGDPQVRSRPTMKPRALRPASRTGEGGVALRDQAVLCRTNRRLNEIARALEERGIPVLHLGSLFEREEIRDLLSILSSRPISYGAGLVRIAAMPRYEHSASGREAAARPPEGWGQAPLHAA